MSTPPRPAAPTMVNGFDPQRISALSAKTRDAIQRRNQVLGPVYRLFYDDPVEVLRGSGTYLYDSDGNQYLDAYNNVPCIGHSHPAVADAVARQLHTVNTNTRYLQPSVTAYAEDLLSTFPAALSNIVFTCSGSEANDLALRVAKYVTGNRGIIVTANAYHGVTETVAAISPSLGTHSPLDIHVRVVEPLDCDRADRGGHLRDQIRSATEDLHRHGVGLAAFIADSIFSSDGVISDPPGFLAPAIEEVHRAGGLYIADEVQPGFGRTGQAWWGFQRHGIEPDIATIGKPMGNGMPIAAAIFRPDLLVEFGQNIRYFNTFGGNTVCIAAAQAVLDTIRSDGLIERAARVGAHLKAGVLAASSENRIVGDVRGCGLFLGVDVIDPADGTPDPAQAAAVVNELRRRRVLISASGPRGNVLKIRPPLAFDEPDADRFLTEFAAALVAAQ
ncbi:aminotransferase [Mycolicibacterium anyangense]|uniref:Aminotransferase n=1 Tax=Mycolicibacterium anyangense TaxID=1431246 RepID=A0A6N4WJT1_9MYCO|nr:aspartate aminotransferase family protein [Mycolicibacterium anyangense]BBZ79411.1 aminotransferase [Mycolicibacterium anyangense]